MKKYFNLILNKIKIKSKSIKKVDDFELPNNINFCHQDKVHIFVRGLADGKLHVAKNRNYSDFRFYKKDHLKVFCATCRKRIV